MILLSCQSVLAEQHSVLLPGVYKLAVGDATHKIKGVVVDQMGEPIIGANVVVKGSSMGTITGIDGDFTLDVSPNSILKISYIGFLMLKKLTPAQRYNVNVSGGNDKTTFYSSVGYLNQSGMYKIGEDKFQRLNTRLSVDNKTTDWLKLGAKVLYNYSSADKPHPYKDDVWQQMVFSTPTRMARPWDVDERYPELDQYAGKYFDDQNPISLLERGGRNKNKTHDVWLTGSADLTFTKEWKARVDFTYNLNYGSNSAHRKRIDMITNSFVETEGNTNNNSYSWSNLNKDYYSFNAYTEYEKTFFDKHYLKGMLGFNQELTKYRSSTATRQNMISQELPSLGLGTGMQTVAESGYEWALRGGFFRLNYMYDNRYLVEVNGRYDGTSRFPSDNRFVFLPSFSGAWRISEEAFMKDALSWMDNLKIRASYGALGNQLLTASGWGGNTKYYPYIPFMSSGTAGNWLFNDNEKLLYINPAGLVSNSLTWEKASTFNIGADVTLLNQKLDVSFDWYQRTTSDMLVRVEYPEILGTTAPPANKAELRTRGWELSVKWNDRIGKDFTYDVGVILSDSQAEITKYENKTGSLGDYYEGQKIGEIWGYETGGFFQYDEDVTNHADQSKLGSNWAPGDIKYVDLNGDDKINNGANTLSDHGDLRVIGNTTPRYQYGISANMTYKQVYLNLFFQGIGKRDFWREVQSDNYVSKSNSNHATYTRVALALKSRVCLYEGTFRKYHNLGDDVVFLQEAAKAAEELMAMKKYSLYNTGAPQSDYKALLRYAEVLLNLAEAKAELGTITQTDIDATINQLRDRAGMPHLTMNPPMDPKYAGVGYAFRTILF